VARFDSSGNLGIGTTSPTFITGTGMEVSRTGGVAAIQATRSDASIAGGIAIQGGSGQNNLNSAGAKPLVFYTDSTDRMRITSTGDVGIGTSSPSAFSSKLALAGSSGSGTTQLFVSGGGNAGDYGVVTVGTSTTARGRLVADADNGNFRFDTAGGASGAMVFLTGSSYLERMRINSSGDLLVGRTDAGAGNPGGKITATGFIEAVVNGSECFAANRKNDDGNLMLFQQQNSTEGTISVSGTTVSYNGGNLSRWSQLPDGSKDESIVKGTVMSNLDDMCVWEKDGVVAENEQLNKMKVSDVEGDTNVAGVFVNWTMDADYGVDDMNVAMTGDMIIRIAQGVVVQKGDLLMSAGDGTAKPQGDDIVRSKTIAKVTSNHVTCTYADGSYCVPCVLMAC
jgi:hypothetical protein